jgi:PAS domain S-box-containing protein
MNKQLLTKYEIAVVEDEPILSLDIRQTLESMGFSVPVICVSGEEILYFLKTHSVDLILMDITLKGNLDGIQTADLIRQKWDIPVIYLTGMGDEASVLRACDTHPYGFLYKPFEPRMLFANIETALSRHNQGKELRRTEEKYFRLYNSMIDGFCRTGPNGRIIEFNEAYRHMLGYTAEEIKKLSYTDITPERWHSTEFHIIQDEVLPLGFSRLFEKEYIRKDGSVFPVELRYHLAKNDNGGIEGMWTIVRDITDRKKAEEAVLASETRYSETIELLPLGIYECTMAGLITFANREAFVYFSMDESDFKKGKYIFDVIIPEDADKARKMIMNHLQHEPITDFDYTGLRKDGTTFPLEIHSSIIFKNGMPVGMRGVLLDLTFRKKMEEELFKSSRLESVGILAGGIAHDFNNILTAMLGNISLSRMSLSADNPCQSLLNDAEKAGFRAKDLTQQLLTFSRGGAPVKESMFLPAIIRDSAEFVLRGSFSKCTFVLPHDLWPVHADKGQISQVIQNLIINANQAMPKGGIITVSSSNREIRTGEQSHLTAGRYVLIQIQDSGVGIDEKLLHNIFDPYFTTKDTGNGLGLSICYSIIKNHGGIIEVESEIGKGTLFTVLLPAADSFTESEQSAQTASLLNGSGRILIMDDDTMINDFLKSLLVRFGYDVETVPDGQTALELYDKAAEHNNPFHLVIMDLTIPGKMGGRETIVLLKAKYPEAKVIVSSGYATDPVMTNFRDYGFSAILPKPFDTDDLLKTIKTILPDGHTPQ